MRTIGTIFGSTIGVILAVVLVIALAFGGIWLNGQLQRAQNDANTNARQTSQQFIQAKQALMEGLAQDFYREDCDQHPQEGVCVAIVTRLRTESQTIDAQYVPQDVNVILVRFGGR